MDKKWRKSIFQLLPLNGRYFLTVALKNYNYKKYIGSLKINDNNTLYIDEQEITTNEYLGSTSAHSKTLVDYSSPIRFR